MFQVTSIYKTTERDSYDEGCIGESHDIAYQYHITSENKEGFLSAFAKHVGVPVIDVCVNPCGDDASRVEAQRTETKDGEAPAEWQIEEWKRGTYVLYLATYTAYVQLVTPANMEA